MNTGIENNLTDKYLVDKVLSGDTQAFGTIIKNTERLVAQIVFKMVSNVEDRKDIAQDIYLKAFKSLPYFRFQAKVSTWIGQIAFNTCVSYLQKKKLILFDNKYGDHEANEDPLEIISHKMADTSITTTESLVFEKQRSEIVNAEIDRLPALYRTLIILYHQEDLSYAEMATITALPEGTVKSYLFRARKSLKENLLAKYKKEAL